MSYLSFNHISDYPADRETNWSEGLQGVTHDDGHWFIVQQNCIWKIPVEADLNSNIGTSYPGVITKPIPPELSAFNHLGDPDYYNGYLFIGVEEEDKIIARIACFDATTLNYIGSVEVPEQKGHASWCAVNPADGLLYSSWYDEVTYLFAYRWFFTEVSFDHDNSIGIGFGLELHHTVDLKDGDGNEFMITAIQGGVFTSINSGENHLYLSSDANDNKMRGFHVFSWPEAKRFQFVAIEDDRWTTGEELEGITYWDLDGGEAPGISGQVHVLDRDNDSWWDWDLDDVKCFKHYSIQRSEFVANSNPSKKEVHRANCQWVGFMKPEHKVPYQTLEAALNDGFDGCHYCLGEHDRR